MFLVIIRKDLKNLRESKKNNKKGKNIKQPFVATLLNKKVNKKLPEIEKSHLKRNNIVTGKRKAFTYNMRYKYTVHLYDTQI